MHVCVMCLLFSLSYGSCTMILVFVFMQHTASVKTPLAFRKVNQKRANLPSEGSPDLAAEKTVFVSNPGELEFMPLNCDQG